MPSGLPGYGNVPLIQAALSSFDSRFTAMWVDDGSHGITLAVFNPKASCAILSAEAL